LIGFNALRKIKDRTMIDVDARAHVKGPTYESDEGNRGDAACSTLWLPLAG